MIREPSTTIELSVPITRANVEAVLDAGDLYCSMTNGRWWRVRRNGATQRWKRDASRIRLPFKTGWKGYGQITEDYFIHDQLDPTLFRHVLDTPQGAHS